MRTRTLLLLSVGTALAILVAGGIFLVQLAAQDDQVPLIEIGQTTTVGDVTVAVLGSDESEDVVAVDVEIGGVEDADGIDSFRLVTGDRRLEPIAAPADGRCPGIAMAVVRCRVDFDVTAAATSSRVLVMRRGDDQANWRLG
jgi:hypothetical protein